MASVYGAPPQFESTMRAHYNSRVTKGANAVAHGAVGTISLDSPVLEQLYPFKDRVNDLAFPDMHWLDARGRPNDYFPELRATAILSMEATAGVFEGSGRSVEEIYTAAKKGSHYHLLCRSPRRSGSYPNSKPSVAPTLRLAFKEVTPNCATSMWCTPRIWITSGLVSQ